MRIVKSAHRDRFNAANGAPSSGRAELIPSRIRRVLSSSGTSHCHFICSVADALQRIQRESDLIGMSEPTG